MSNLLLWMVLGGLVGGIIGILLGVFVLWLKGDIE